VHERPARTGTTPQLIFHETPHATKDMRLRSRQTLIQRDVGERWRLFEASQSRLAVASLQSPVPTVDFCRVAPTALESDLVGVPTRRPDCPPRDFQFCTVKQIDRVYWARRMVPPILSRGAHPATACSPAWCSSVSAHRRCGSPYAHSRICATGYTFVRPTRKWSSTA
jgi:hypothetical protein